MAETTLSTRRAGARREGVANGARPLRRHRALPGGRAVVGGFLVALAAVGVFAGYTSATADTREPYLVARQDLALGHRITKDDLGTLPMDLPALLRSKVYRDPSQLVGAMVIGPVTKGELVQSSSVQTGDVGDADRQISISIDSARAMNGQLRRGEFVDVVATYGIGTDGYTTAVVRGARVADRSETRGALSDGGNEVITLALPEQADTLAVAHAANTGSIMLVRVAGPPAAGDEAPPVYQPPAKPAGDTATAASG
ncbi:MAG: SAF domain-containing protein [Acidimicrobiales bacterium]